MATIDYKQKIKDYMNSSEVDTLYKSMLNNLFPELKESEDERVKKEIISAIKEDWPGHTDWIDWLEKQGEQKTVDDLTQQEAMDIAVAKCFEQGEQNHADEVKPKFNVGDWLIRNDIVGVACCIAQIHEPYYYLTNDHTFISFREEDKYRLWTIQDAKDGDVLCSGQIIVIFKHFEDPSYRQHIVAYIGLDTSGNVQITDGIWTLGIDKAKPATKEQRDLLFKKMKEAGYKWNAEKKLLKKIEQKPVENKGMNLNEEDMTPFQKEVFCIIDTAIEEEQGLKQVCDKLFALASNEIKQKPAEWSEEDETVLNNLIYALANDRIGNDRDEYVSWLKFLKQRIGG